MRKPDNNEGSIGAIADVPGEKSALRRRALALRGGLDVETRQEFSRIIVNNFLRLGLLRRAGLMHAYLSFGSEVATGELLAAAFAAGLRVATSAVVSGSVELLHAEITPTARFAPGKFGVPVPLDATFVHCETLAMTPADVVVVPVAAFDRRRNRLGYGKGYYDRFLAKTAAIRVGFAFSCQEVPLIPHEPHDIPLDMIVTETETFGSRTRHTFGKSRAHS